MRIPTKDELERRKNSPEDVFEIPDDEGPVNLDDLIDINVAHLLESRSGFEYRKRLCGYYAQFTWWAKQEGLEATPDAWPQFAGLELPDPKEYSLTVNPLDEDAVIEGRIEAFKRRVLEEVQRERQGLPNGWVPFFMTRYARDQRGLLKKPSELFTMVEDVLKVKALYAHGGASHYSVAFDMGWIVGAPDEKQCAAAERKAARYLEKANALIASTMQGTFQEELSKPIK